MAAKGLDAVFQHLRRAVLLREGSGITDDQLLESFVSNRDGAAFEALVRRHGRMVQGVCARVLRNVHDAEDAYQATFLVLAQKAAKVFPRAQVGNWLYGVANTTALRSRSAAARRQARERQVDHMPERSSPEPADWNDLIPVLDQELTKLPSKYRIAIVLCDLEGRSRKDVAKQLKIPEGTLSSRLTTARQMLAKRLSRHGLAITGPVLASLLAQNALSACVPPTLVAATVKAAGLIAAGQAVTSTLVSAPVLALKKGVLKVMLIHKLKSLTAVVVMLGAFGYGGTLVSQRAGAQSKGAGTLRVASAAIGSAETDDKPAQDGDGKKRAPASKEKDAKPAEEDLFLKPLAKERVEQQRQMNNMLLNAEVTYWNLYKAYGELYGVEEVLRGLHKLGQDTKFKDESGDGKTPPDLLAQIKGQYEEFRGERTIALAAVLEAEKNLCKVLGIPLSQESEMRLVPVSLPAVGSFEPKWDEKLKDALIHRPEVLLAQENLKIYQFNLAGEKNTPALERSDKQQFTQRRSERLHLAQAYYVLKDQEDRVESTLAQQYTGLAKWHRLIEDRRAERRVYVDSLGKRLKQLEQGKKSILDLLDVQRRLALAQTKEYQAIAEFNNTLARLDFASGTVKLKDLIIIGEKGLNPNTQDPKVYGDRESTLVLRRRPELFSKQEKTPPLPVLLDLGLVPGVTEVAPQPKEYSIEITLIEADPAGEDFGKMGKGKVLSRPQLILLENQSAIINTGKSVSVPKGESGAAKTHLAAGIAMQMKVIPQPNGLLRLESEIETTTNDQSDDKIAQVSGIVLHSVALIKESETFLLLIKNNKNKVTHWVKIKVSEYNEEYRKKMEQDRKDQAVPGAFPPPSRPVPEAPILRKIPYLSRLFKKDGADEKKGM